MTRVRPLFALALLASACGGSSKKAEPLEPDLTAPRIANPVNVNVGRRDVLRVRFTERVVTTASTAVEVREDGGATVAAAITFAADGTLEVVPSGPLPLPATIEVQVRNVGDAAGNLLLQESAFFRIAGWASLGLDSAVAPGPLYVNGPEVARAAGVTQVVWPGALASLAGGVWTVTGTTADPQAVASDGPYLLRLERSSTRMSLTSAVPGEPGTSSFTPVDSTVTASVGACQGASGRDAVVAWQEVPSQLAYTVVRAARWDGTWLDLGVVGGSPGNYAWNPAAACDPVGGSSWVAFEQEQCGGPSPCVRLMRRIRTDIQWTELPSPATVALHPALLANGDQPVLAYTRFPGTGADAVVEQYQGAGWVSLGALDTDRSLYADEVAMAWDYTAGGLLAAWAEYPQGRPEQARVHVKRWDGTAWTLVGKGPVNDEEPFRPARRPSVAMGTDGVAVIAYLEWDGTGTVESGASNHRVRVKRLWR